MHFPGRVTFGEIQFGEIIVVTLDVGPFRHRESHVRENSNELISDLTDRMRAASSAASSLADATAASKSFSSCAMSVMGNALGGHRPRNRIIHLHLRTRDYDRWWVPDAPLSRGMTNDSGR